MTLPYWARVMWAETYKQVRLYWGQPGNLLLEALYPGFYFLSAYYMFRPFMDLSQPPPWLAAGKQGSLALFLLIGFLGFSIFQRLLFTGLGMVFGERQSGTLELQYLSPASRFALLIGASIGGIVCSLYLYVAFLVGAAVFFGGWHLAHPAMLLVALLALFVPAVAWGALVSSFILFARDGGTIVQVVQPPLNFFGGMRFPVQLLPAPLPLVSALLPLAWSLSISRAVLLDAAPLADVAPSLAAAAALSALSFAFAELNLRRSERAARDRGTFALY